MSTLALSGSSSVYSSDKSTITTTRTTTVEDEFGTRRLKPVTRLNPIVINGEFSEDNPYISLPKIVSKHQVSDDFLKIMKYETFFSKMLQEFEQMRCDLKLGKDLEIIFFNNLNTFKLLNQFFLKQLNLSLGYNNLLEILRHHLINFIRAFTSYSSNYEILRYGLPKLQKKHKKLRKFHLGDKIFQYPISYIEYYSKIESNLDLKLNLQQHLPEQLSFENVELLINRYQRHYKSLIFLQNSLLSCPFDFFLQVMVSLTRLCQITNESIIDPNIQFTCTTEKFMGNANKTIYEIIEWKLFEDTRNVNKLWMRMCDSLSQLIYNLENTNDQIEEYWKYTTSKVLLKNLDSNIKLVKNLTEKIPIVDKLLLRYIDLFKEYFNVTLLEILQILGKQKQEEDIVDMFKRQTDFKKMTILQLSYRKEKVLKYYFNASENDIVPLTPTKSFVINKIFS